jgi:hypothetical protein
MFTAVSATRGVPSILEAPVITLVFIAIVLFKSKQSSCVNGYDIGIGTHAADGTGGLPVPVLQSVLPAEFRITRSP